MWQVRAIHDGGNFVDVFLDLASATRWADALCAVLGWDHARGDRQIIERVAS
jgi:hypothetical protein